MIGKKFNITYEITHRKERCGVDCLTFTYALHIFMAIKYLAFLYLLARKNMDVIYHYQHFLIPFLCIFSDNYIPCVLIKQYWWDFGRIKHVRYY